MKTLKTLIAISAFACGSLLAQSEYTVQSDRNLSAAADAVTIQQPATGATLVGLTGLTVTCSVACDVTIERNGVTPAVNTAATPIALVETMNAAKATVFTASDVGNGTVISKTPLLAGVASGFDVSKLKLMLHGTSHNYTVRVSAITGRSTITLRWQETPLPR